jgi:hypothetical protein
MGDDELTLLIGGASVDHGRAVLQALREAHLFGDGSRGSGGGGGGGGDEGGGSAEGGWSGGSGEVGDGGLGGGLGGHCPVRESDFRRLADGDARAAAETRVAAAALSLKVEHAWRDLTALAPSGGVAWPACFQRLSTDAEIAALLGGSRGSSHGSRLLEAIRAAGAQDGGGDGAADLAELQGLFARDAVAAAERTS